MGGFGSDDSGMKRTCLLLIAAIHMAGAAIAADWPRISGPHGDCTSPETGLMKQWPAGGPRELWQTSVGSGFGGVAVKDGEVYLLDRDPGKTDILRCFDLSTGKHEWELSYDAPGMLSFPGSRSHPATDDKYVFIFSPFGELRCVSRSTHEMVWMKDAAKDSKAKTPGWAFSQSPALYGNTVIVAPNGNTAAIAYDKDTGEVVWKSAAISGKTSYASPMPVSIGGVDQILVLTSGALAGLDAATGETLWTTEEWRCKIPIACPVHLKDGLVFVTGGYGAGCALMKVVRNESGFSVSTVFKSDSSNGQMHQPVFYEDHLYLNGNDKSKKYGFICIDLAGRLKWQTGRSPGFDWGGVLLADGLIYTVDGTTGDLCMIKPDPAGYNEIARANFLEGKQIWSTIALSDGKLLLRDKTRLKCIDVRGE